LLSGTPFTAASAAGEPAREDAGEAIPPALGQPRLRCTIIGPSKAGKTNFLDSFDQSCADPSAYEGPVRLEHVGGQQTAEQTKRSARIIAEPTFSLPPTDRTSWYEAFVTATKPGSFWRSETRQVLHLLIKDGQGGALFPAETDRGNPLLPEWEREMVEESRRADAIVLCIDSTDPQLDQVSRFLRNILAAVAVPLRVSPARPPLGPRLLARLQRKPPPPAMTLKRIPAQRFLLLLTKIDRLVSQPLDAASPIGERGRAPAPREIAAGLSPVDLACELFHASNLLRILSALKPGAELAVGLTSAWGFDASGFPFMEENNPVRLSTQSRDRQTADWHPLGVRESLLFLLDGRTGGPVERVTAKRISGSRSQVLDLPTWYFA